VTIAISAALVKELRDQTGAPMMDCKRALEDAEGDLEAAKRLLRERGMAQAAKRADRTTTEGKVGYRLADDGARATMVAVGCETEPVSNNEEFLTFAKKVLEAVEAYGPGAEQALDDERQELSGKLGENIVVAGVARFEAVDGAVIAGYVHPPANKIGALVHVRGANPELAREVAMHISFAKPRFVRREEVPAEEVEAERDILRSQEDVQSKPEQVREKMVEGRLQKWFADSVLLDQPWYRSTGETVAAALGSADVLEFALFALAG
jgi:elongation factor Ts